MRSLALAVLVVGCGTSSMGDDGGPSGGDDDGGPVDPPVARCDAPALADVSHPTTTIGDGTAASCTETALRQAASTGGTIVFACGTAPVTIAVTSQVTVTTETILDGGGLVTLSGGGSSRILYLDSDYNTATPRLTVQRLTFVDGNSPATGDDTAQGGGAIYRDGGSLTVIDSQFDNNHGPATGQDVAGGAIYGFGGGEIVIVGSTFTHNEASDGGAIGSLNGDVTIINSSLEYNAATGSGGNPGNGGCGGAVYMDGGDEAASLCGVTIRNNTAGAIGGGVFRVSNDNSGSFAMDRSTIDANTVTPTKDGNAGGMYLQGLALTITASTISANQAYYDGGLWLSHDKVAMTNVTIANNTATGSNGGGLWLDAPTGTLTNCTIAGNRSTGDSTIAGAIFGDGLTLVNTLIADNTAMYTPGCSDERSDGTGNLQWPDGALCTHSPVIANPMLGTLQDNGGDTFTMVPAAGGPAMGIGTSCPPMDQLGKPRGEPCTAGAVE